MVGKAPASPGICERAKYGKIKQKHSLSPVKQPIRVLQTAAVPLTITKGFMLPALSGLSCSSGVGSPFKWLNLFDFLTHSNTAFKTLNVTLQANT